MRALLPLINLSIALLLLGCASTSTTQGWSDGAFPMTSGQADRIILESIHEGWPGKDPERLGSGRIGYKFKVWWAIDHDNVTAEAIPQGAGHYAFRVDNVGTAPLSGDPARERLLALIVAKARALAMP